MIVSYARVDVQGENILPGEKVEIFFWGQGIL